MAGRSSSLQPQAAASLPHPSWGPSSPPPECSISPGCSQRLLGRVPWALSAPLIEGRGRKGGLPSTITACRETLLASPRLEKCPRSGAL